MSEEEQAPVDRPGDRCGLIVQWTTAGYRTHLWLLESDERDDYLPTYLEEIKGACERTLSLLRRGKEPFGDGITAPRRRE